MPSPEPPIQDQPDDPGPDEPDSIGHADAIRVEVVNHLDAVDTQRDDWLVTQVRRAVDLCGITQAQLTVAIVGDEEMAELHEQYTGVQGTTDVLTFDLIERAESASPHGSTEHPTDIEGDIVVCLDEAKRQADQRDHDASHELLLYAVHGLMHLLGEDDHDENDYRRMHAREDSLLEQMGFGPLFNPDRSSPQP